MTGSGHPPFDPELAQLLDPIRAQLPTPLTVAALLDLRASTAARAAPLDDYRDDYQIDHLTVPGPGGAADLALLVVRPGAAEAALPVLYYIHGGGMITGNARSGLDRILALEDATPMVIVSVDYRLAPEHQHPIPSEDCYAGLSWLADHAADVGGDPERIVVAGISAGGGLAAACALMARDRGGPPLVGQMLMCPMLDDREITPSSTELVDEGIWDREANRFGWQALLGGAAGGANVSKYAAPARELDLSRLPPAFIDVGSVETFRDEDVDYAVRIWRCGGQAELHVWPGGFHGFDAVPDARLSQAARAARLDWVRRTLAT